MEIDASAAELRSVSIGPQRLRLRYRDPICQAGAPVLRLSAMSSLGCGSFRHGDLRFAGKNATASGGRDEAAISLSPPDIDVFSPPTRQRLIA
ncbi:hypothetical protein KM043_001918 [Ampulex compressa]|nr:hypothetical protein KM043_001918 [Ampulex compressa]